jgi:hypothetical protein
MRFKEKILRTAKYRLYRVPLHGMPRFIYFGGCCKISKNLSAKKTTQVHVIRSIREKDFYSLPVIVPNSSPIRIYPFRAWNNNK